MAWQIGVEPHLQNHSSREPGYVPVHDLSCATGIADPESLIRLHWEHTRVVGTGKDKRLVRGDESETIKAARLFVMARNVELGADVFAHADNNQPFMESVPTEIRDSAVACAQTILAGECPMYYFAEGALRLKDGPRYRQILESVV